MAGGHGRHLLAGQPAGGGHLLRLPGVLQGAGLGGVRPQLLPGLHPQELAGPGEGLPLPPVPGGLLPEEPEAQPAVGQHGGDHQPVQLAGGQGGGGGGGEEGEEEGEEGGRSLWETPGSPQALLQGRPEDHLRGLRQVPRAPAPRRGPRGGGHRGVQGENPEPLGLPEEGEAGAPGVQGQRRQEDPGALEDHREREAEGPLGVREAAAVPPGPGARPPGAAGEDGEERGQEAEREHQRPLQGDHPPQQAPRGAGGEEPGAPLEVPQGRDDHPTQERGGEGPEAPPRLHRHEVARLQFFPQNRPFGESFEEIPGKPSGRAGKRRKRGPDLGPGVGQPPPHPLGRPEEREDGLQEAGPARQPQEVRHQLQGLGHHRFPLRPPLLGGGGGTFGRLGLRGGQGVGEEKRSHPVLPRGRDLGGSAERWPLLGRHLPSTHPVAPGGEVDQGEGLPGLRRGGGLLLRRREPEAHLHLPRGLPGEGLPPLLRLLHRHLHQALPLRSFSRTFLHHHRHHQHHHHHPRT